MKTRKIIYIGRRLSGTKVLSAFLDGKKQIYFKGTIRAIIGFTYEMNSDETIAKRPKIANSNLPVSKADLIKWEAEDAVVVQFQRERRFTSEMNRNSALKKAIRPIREALGDLNFSEKRLLANYLTELLWKEKK